MRKTNVTVLIDVEIYDKREVIQACRAQMKRDGVKPWRLTAEQAVQYLIDPSTMPGCTVLESSVYGGHF
jgi:hypothetical protein